MKSILQANVQESEISTSPTDQEKKPNFTQRTKENMKRMLNEYREKIIPLAIVLGVFGVTVATVVVVTVVPEEFRRLGNL